jgi:hypothetical protein
MRLSARGRTPQSPPLLNFSVVSLRERNAWKLIAGPREVFMCGIAQYVNLWGTMVGYTITATISMA